MTCLGVMAVDPGLRTGVALGVYERDRSLTVRERVERALALDRVRSFEVVLDVADGACAELSAAVEIARAWTEFLFSCTVPSGSELAAREMFEPCEAVMVMEEWTPRLPLKSGKREAFYPIRIAANVEGLLFGKLGSGAGAHSEVRVPGFLSRVTTVPCYQTPSQAKRFATDARLRSWGLWRAGSDHERDAYRHTCTFLAGL